MITSNTSPDPNSPPDIYDLTIIGGGPAGLFAAYYAGLRQLRTKIIDSLPDLGGQLVALYPEKFIFDVPGFPKILAKDLAANLIEQAFQHNIKPTVALSEFVQDLQAVPSDTPAPLYQITTDRTSHFTRTLLICAGSGAFSPKKLTLPNAAQFENRGIHYAVKSKAVFAGKHVLIIGGGDSAIDWSLNLQDTAASITLIHRRNIFRAHEHAVRALQATPTKILTPYEIDSLLTDGDRLIGAILHRTDKHEKHPLPFDVIIAQIGFNSSLGPIKNWPIGIERASIRVNSHMETLLPGIFAAGDVTVFDGKLKLIATGFGEAVIAVNHAKQRIDPAAKLFPGHSSEMVAQAPGIEVPTA